MANRVRPRCPECETVMDPIYRTGPRGGFTRIRDAFHCAQDGTLARGRRKVRALPA